MALLTCGGCRCYRRMLNPQQQQRPVVQQQRSPAGSSSAAFADATSTTSGSRAAAAATPMVAPPTPSAVLSVAAVAAVAPNATPASDGSRGLWQFLTRSPAPAEEAVPPMAATTQRSPLSPLSPGSPSYDRASARLGLSPPALPIPTDMTTAGAAAAIAELQRGTPLSAYRSSPALRVAAIAAELAAIAREQQQEAAMVDATGAGPAEGVPPPSGLRIDFSPATAPSPSSGSSRGPSASPPENGGSTGG